MSSIGRRITAPKRFRANHITGFINDCQVIFKLVGKKEPNFLLKLDKTSECDMIGVLLVYKVIEFSMKNDCFLKGKYLMGNSFQAAMGKYGFTDLIVPFLKGVKVVEKEFTNLKISVTENFIIAPQALLRNDKFSSELLSKNYLPQIEKYYAQNKKGKTMILTCFSEVFLNFWEHAIDETQSIILANGTQERIEIACADNGKGIVSTLSLAGKNKKDKLKTFISAVQKGVTSRGKSNHMGYGLWIIDEIVKRTGGRFHLYSEGCYYQREFGKVTHGVCGQWQGTIVYISLPLNNPVTLSDFENPEANSNYNLNINWS